MNVTAQDCDSDGKFGGQMLKSDDQVSPLVLVVLGRVMVVQVVQKIHGAIELIEEVSSETKTLI